LAGQPQPFRWAAQLLEQIARGVHAVHQMSIIHRDLKPGNVLLQADGTPKLTDFGLAKLLDLEKNFTQTGGVVGTVAYMGPEQARGRSKAVGPGADIYALGAILYEMLTGRPPFVGENPIEILYAVTEKEPVPPRRLRPQLPRDLETICL